MGDKILSNHNLRYEEHLFSNRYKTNLIIFVHGTDSNFNMETWRGCQ